MVSENCGANPSSLSLHKNVRREREHKRIDEKQYYRKSTIRHKVTRIDKSPARSVGNASNIFYPVISPASQRPTDIKDRVSMPGGSAFAEVLRRLQYAE